MTTWPLMDEPGHPLAARLLRFNLLPSRLYPPARQGEWLPPALAVLATGDGLEALHRQASAALLRRGGLGWVRRLDDPALPLCLCPQDLFDRLLLACGLVLLAPQLRQVIARAEVACLRQALGPQGLDFARRQAAAAPGALGLSVRLEPDRAREQAQALGAELLARAFVAADPAVGQRGLMRLPPAADLLDAARPVAAQDEGAALALARSVLLELDPEWLSSFPAPR